MSKFLSDTYPLPACCSMVQFHIKSVTSTQESVPSNRFCWESVKDACMTKHGQSSHYMEIASPLCWVWWLSDAVYISLFPPSQELKCKCTHHVYWNNIQISSCLAQFRIMERRNGVSCSRRPRQIISILQSPLLEEVGLATFFPQSLKRTSLSGSTLQHVLQFENQFSTGSPKCT